MKQRYAAFISYSHADEEFCDKLHTKLESYKIPQSLLKRERDGIINNSKIGKVFRDRSDLSASHDLGANIKSALERSDALIVLCSPNASKSAYVNEEIRTFRSLGMGHRIFAAIIDGEPHAHLSSATEKPEECFPQALFEKLQFKGEQSESEVTLEPIAADFRTGKDGWENGSLKLIAGLLEVDLDELVQREKRAEQLRRRQARAIATGMSLLALFAVIFALIAFQREQLARSVQNKILTEKSMELSDDGFFADAQVFALEALPSGRGFLRPNPLSEDALAALYRGVANNKESVRLIGHESTVTATAIGKNNIIYTASADGTLRKWDGLDGTELVKIDVSPAAILSLKISNDKEIIAFGTNSGVVEIWDASLESRRASFQAHETEIWGVCFSPDASRLLTSSFEPRAKVWRLDPIKLLGSLHGHEAALSTCAISNDGHLLALASHDGTVSVWDAQTLKIVSRLIGHTDQVWNVDFSHDSELVATASVDKTARVWNSISGEEKSKLMLHDAIVTSARFSPDGQSLATTSYDGAIRIWDFQESQLIEILRGHYRTVMPAVYSDDGRWLVSASDDNTARIWRTNVHEPKRLLSLDSASTVWLAPTFGNFVVQYENSHTSFRASTSDDVQSQVHLGDRSVVDFSSSRNGMVHSSVDNDGLALVSLNGHDFEIEKEAVTRTAVSENGAFVALVMNDGSANIYDSASPQSPIVLSIPESEFLIAEFSASGKLVATASSDYVLRLWDSETGELIKELSGHGDITNSLAFSSDETQLLSGSGDTTSRIWSLDSDSSELVLEGHDAPVVKADWSPVANRIVTSSVDSTIRVWSQNGREIARRSGPISIDFQISLDGGEIMALTDTGELIMFLLPTAAGRELIDLVCQRSLQSNSSKQDWSAFTQSSLASERLQDRFGLSAEGPCNRLGILSAEYYVHGMCSSFGLLCGEQK